MPRDFRHRCPSRGCHPREAYRTRRETDVQFGRTLFSTCRATHLRRTEIVDLKAFSAKSSHLELGCRSSPTRSSPRFSGSVQCRISNVRAASGERGVLHVRSPSGHTETPSSTCATVDISNSAVGENMDDSRENSCELVHLELRLRRSRCRGLHQISQVPEYDYITIATRDVGRSATQVRALPRIWRALLEFTGEGTCSGRCLRENRGSTRANET